MVDKDALHKGIALLTQPVLPLVSMVQFLYLTGDFSSVDEVIGQMPPDIETGFATYGDPVSLLQSYADLLQPLVELKAGKAPEQLVVDVDNHPLDAMTATAALVAQNILTRELEPINSLLCAPCGCSLCCVGPEAEMQQSYFEIPLQPGEVVHFPLERVDTPASRASLIEDEPALQVENRDFYQRPDPVLIHWQPGWSLILPTASRCPHLEQSGRCRIYPHRPHVCRRPQIFPYMLEPLKDKGQATFRLRQSLLAVVDCPYVQLLQEEISAYAAASELEMIFRQNKA
ncbi:MAG: YkgJ family cysteine cluster protein [Desulfobulbus sp.]|nr:YkgJ family cysteine cluster protein [Desulfobulbus sp.]